MNPSSVPQLPFNLSTPLWLWKEKFIVPAFYLWSSSLRRTLYGFSSIMNKVYKWVTQPKL